jgi:hypothetical protein
MTRFAVFVLFALIGFPAAAQAPVNLTATSSPPPPPICPYGSALGDGCPGAPVGGNVQYTNFFTVRAPRSGQTYATRPPWNVAGVDYPVGVPAASFPLKDPSSSTPTGCSPVSGGIVTCNGTGDLTIDGWDFGKANCIFLDIKGYTGTITIKNSNFLMGSSSACQNNYGLITLEGSTNGSSLVVINNVFDDNATTYPGISNVFDVRDVYRSTGSSLYEYNAFLHSIGQTIQSASTGVWVAQYNYIEGLNYGSGVHGEVTMFAGAASPPTNVTINYNTFLEPPSYGGGMTTTYYISSGAGGYPTFGTVNIENNTTVINLYGGNGGSVAVAAALAEFARDQVTTANVLNDYIDPTGSYFCIKDASSGNIWGTANVSGNINLLNGSPITTTDNFNTTACYGHH